MPIKELLSFISQLSVEEISKLTEIAESMLSNTQPQPDEGAEAPSIVAPAIVAPPEKKIKNLFDEMPERNHHKDPEDKKLYSSPITPRRQEVSMLELKCRSCGTKSSVPPQLSPLETERYLCNKCAKFGGT